VDAVTFTFNCFLLFYTQNLRALRTSNNGPIRGSLYRQPNIAVSVKKKFKTRSNRSLLLNSDPWTASRPGEIQTWMPQQYLHLPEIHAFLHQVNGKAMSERMRMDIHQIILPLLHNDIDLTAFDSKYRLIQGMFCAEMCSESSLMLSSSNKLFLPLSLAWLMTYMRYT